MTGEHFRTEQKKSDISSRKFGNITGTYLSHNSLHNIPLYICSVCGPWTGRTVSGRCSVWRCRVLHLHTHKHTQPETTFIGRHSLTLWMYLKTNLLKTRLYLPHCGTGSRGTARGENSAGEKKIFKWNKQNDLKANK